MTILVGDNRDILPTIPDKSVDLVITSPPYFGQREYDVGTLGGESDSKYYIDNLLEIMDELIRVLKDTGSIVYNIGDKYINGSWQLIPYRFASKVMEEFHLRLVNEITWVKTNPAPRSFKTRLTPSTEPFFQFVANFGYYHDVESYQREEAESREKEKKELATVHTDDLGMSYIAKIEKSGLSDDEKSRARTALYAVIDEVKNGDIESFRMKIRGVHSGSYGGHEGGHNGRMKKHGYTVIRFHGRPMKRDVITGAVANKIQTYGHPAVFPADVVREVIRLMCPMGGTVLDPYSGSGTTVVTAMQEGRDAIGIDVSEEYCAIAQERISDQIRLVESRGQRLL